jgi:hypothetical protein
MADASIHNSERSYRLQGLALLIPSNAFHQPTKPRARACRSAVSGSVPGVVALLCLVAAAAPLLSQAAEGEPATRGIEFSAEVALGGEYDSNVTVEEVDRATSEPDYALNVDLGLGAQLPLSQRADLEVSYDFSQSSYRKFSEVDRQTHLLGADLALDFTKVDSNLSFFYILSRLDGDKFLELYRLSPAVSGFLAKKWYARGAYVYSDKSVTQSPERDADTNAVEGDLYFFYRGLRSYFNLGYRFKHEDAVADRLDYQSNGVKLRYILRFELWSRMTKLELAWRYEDRDYSAITPSIGEDRADQRHRWRADYEIPVWKGGAVQFYLSYANYDSNYEPVDYTQTIAGTRFIYRW